MLPLVDFMAAKAKDRILCLHLMVCRSHQWHVSFSMIMPYSQLTEVLPYRRQLVQLLTQEAAAEPAAESLGGGGGEVVG